MFLNLSNFDFIVINTSAGKDSQAMTDYVIREAERCRCSDRVVMVHADLGRVEWQGTLELAREHAAHYGARFEIVKRDVGRDLLAEIIQRGKWPSSTTRYCTSYYKRDQVSKLHTRLAAEFQSESYVLFKNRRTPKILNCLGFRAEESPRRKKLPQFVLNKRVSSGRKQVYDWLPIQDWTLDQVWDRNRKAGTRHHPAYDLGMKRLSCVFCIFAPKAQLMVAAKHNPELFAEYVAAEKQMGHTFRKELALVDVQAAIEANEQPGDDDGAWNM